MPHVQVTIAGRSYRMACGEGEEAHLTSLAESFDGKIAEMRGAFGEIGEMRLHVMAALTLADELAETQERLALTERAVASAEARAEAEARRGLDAEAAAATAVAETADRLEAIARAVAEGRVMPGWDD